MTSLYPRMPSANFGCNWSCVLQARKHLKSSMIFLPHHNYLKYWYGIELYLDFIRADFIQGCFFSILSEKLRNVFFWKDFLSYIKFSVLLCIFSRSYYLTLRKSVIKITNPFNTIDRFTGFRKKEGSSGLLGKLQNWKNFNCSSYRYIVKYCPHQLINNLNYLEFPTKSSTYFHSIFNKVLYLKKLGCH